MSGRQEPRWRRARLAVALVLTAVLALLPLLVSPTPEASIAAGGLALGLAALVVSLGSLTAIRPSTVAAPTAGDDRPLLRPGRVTDPAHHPLTPRAPGLA